MDGSTGDLVALSELGGGGEGADLIGRPVFAGDGTLLGKVADVLAERFGGEPHFMALALEPSVARMQGGKTVYVPFRTVRVDDARRVHLDEVTGESARILPETPTHAPPSLEAATVLDRARAADALATPAVPVSPSPVAGLDASAAGTIAAGTEDARLVLSEESLSVGKRTVTAGEVVVHKHVEEEAFRQTVPVTRDEVDVERRPVPPGVGLEPRTEGDVTYIPLVEEEIVVTKRLVAREELVIRKRRVAGEAIVEETVRRERAEVVRPDEPGGRPGV